MASTSVKLRTMSASLALVLATELLGWWWMQLSNIAPLIVVGLVRIVQIAAMAAIVVKWEGGLSTIGWAPSSWLTGLKKGAIWSMAFGTAAAIAIVAIYLAGQDPMKTIKSPMPSSVWQTGLFFIVGGLIAPVAEELCFRGILYSFFRQWGMLLALLASTAIFVGLHFHALPITQVVGGIVFAIAYETSDNLMVPITIHCLGNLALFSLSLL